MSDITMTVVDGAATCTAALGVSVVRDAGTPFELKRPAPIAGAPVLGVADVTKAADAAVYVRSGRGPWATAGADVDQLVEAVRRPVTTTHNFTFRGRPRGRPV